jgi:hypothetical protein
MQARCGAWQVGNDIDRGRIEFRVFFPTGPDPEIDAIRVAGDFQQALGAGSCGPTKAESLVAWLPLGAAPHARSKM